MDSKEAHESKAILHHRIDTLKEVLARLQDGQVVIMPNPITIPDEKTPPLPTMPIIQKDMSIKQKLESIQKFMSSFEYNHIGRETTSSFPRKDRGVMHIINMAKLFIREALPIQCVEAVFVAVYLTHEMKELLRIPISFRSRVDNDEHYHMILAIKHIPSRKTHCHLQNHSSNNSMGIETWGALGLSRLKNLMYKPLIYPSLTELITEYAISYRNYHHDLEEVSLGLPFPHEYSEKMHQWKVITITAEESTSSSSDEIWTKRHTEKLMRFSKVCTKVGR